MKNIKQPDKKYNDEVLWHQMLNAETDAEFSHMWLGLQSSMIANVHSGVVILENSEKNTFLPAAVWPPGLQEHLHFAKVTEQAVKENKGVVSRNTQGHEGYSSDIRFHLAYPIRAGEKLCGAAALEIGPVNQAGLQSAMRSLQWGIVWLEKRILNQEIIKNKGIKESLTSVLEMTASVLKEKRFQAAATSFATLLAARFNCDRVSIGFAKGLHIQVCALSHSAQFGKKMNLIRAIGAAMDESADQQEILIWPDIERNQTAVLLAHKELAREYGDGAICTIPFISGSGALTLERSSPRPFIPEEIEFCKDISSLAGLLLEEKRENDRLLITKIGKSLFSYIKRLIGPGHILLKLTGITFILLIIFLIFAEGEYRINAEATIQGEIQHAVTAPYAGYIFEADIIAGDNVKKGQIMCSLDDRDLRLERLKWISQRQQQILQYRLAMAENDPAQAKILKEQMNQADVQLKLLDEQLDRIKIRAPFDGLVISGDLSQSIGSPVEQGQVLFEVAPHNAYRLMLQVDERDIIYIKAGQKGELILTAMPDVIISFNVKKITPVSSAEEGRSFFLAEGSLNHISEGLRPGMEGFGKIDAGCRKLIWIWTHYFKEWLRLQLWSWWL